MPYRTIILLAVFAIAGWALSMVLLSVFARKPENLGVVDDKLADCPGSPNCVSSFAPEDDRTHWIAPLRYKGDPVEAWSRAKEIVQAYPRTKITHDKEGYLRAECASRLFRFVDDVELLHDPAQSVIHIRSASRAGRSDLGVNRRRVEEIRSAFEQ